MSRGDTRGREGIVAVALKGGPDLFGAAHKKHLPAIFHPDCTAVVELHHRLSNAAWNDTFPLPDCLSTKFRAELTGSHARL